MKKLLVSCLIMLIMFFTSGCLKHEDVYLDGRHARDDGYGATFHTKYHVFSNLTLHIEEGIFSEDIAKSAADLIKADYKKIKEVGGGLAGPITVYLVKETLQAGPQADGDELFCTFEDIRSGEYRRYLTQVSFRLNCPWKSIGLDWYVFEKPRSENIMDIGELRAYYDDPVNMAALSLIPAYFMGDFADAGMISKAQNTAYSFTEYMISDVGLKNYLSIEDLAEYRQGWLKKIGSSGTIDPLPVNMDDMSYTASKEHPLIVKYHNFIFYFKQTDWIRTADDIYTSLAAMFGQYTALVSSLEEQEPEAYALLSEKIEEEKHIYYEGSNIVYSHASRSNIVRLNDNSAVCHEIVHTLLPSISYSNVWLDEGIATLLTIGLEHKYMSEEKKQSFFDLLTQGPMYSKASQNDRDFVDYVSKYYLDHAPLPSEADDLDFALFYEAIGITTLTHPDLETSLSMARFNVLEIRAQLGNASRKAEGGNVLTYPEAYVLTKYLAKTYGLDTVIAVDKGLKGFETAFQGDFEKVLSEFMAQIPESYRD
jgi:hypothetical protein